MSDGKCWSVRLFGPLMFYEVIHQNKVYRRVAVNCIDRANSQQKLLTFPQSKLVDLLNLKGWRRRDIIIRIKLQWETRQSNDHPNWSLQIADYSAYPRLKPYRCKIKNGQIA